MEELLRNLVENTQGLFAYGLIFGILLACGLGLPLPEDVSLVLGGYLVHKGAASLPAMMLVGFGGILVGDSIIFFIGRRVGSKVGRAPGGFLARIITPERRARVEGLFARHGQKIVMAARFMPGVRAVTYFTAGSAGMPYWRFVFFDGVAALGSAPIFVFLGYYFGGELESLFEGIKRGKLWAVAVVAGAVAVYLALRWIKARKSRTVSEALREPQRLESPAPEQTTPDRNVAPRSRVDDGPRSPVTGRLTTK